jgi:hypothetical protein
MAYKPLAEMTPKELTSQWVNVDESGLVGLTDELWAEICKRMERVEPMRQALEDATFLIQCILIQPLPDETRQTLTKAVTGYRAVLDQKEQPC